MTTLNVSVVIPAYNAEAYLARALRSALHQTEFVDEIVVVDDGSDDRTAKVARSFGERVRVFEQANAGASVARNRAIAETRGEWIAFLDADDEWRPSHIEHALAALRARPSLVWFTAPFERLSDVFPRAELRPDETRLADGGYFADYFVMAASYNNATPATLVRRDVLETLGGFDPDMAVAEDVDLWFRIALDHPEIGYSGEIACTNHTRQGSLSRSGLYTPEKALAFIERCDARARARGDREVARTRGFLAKWTVEVVREATLANNRAVLGRALALEVPISANWRRLGALCRATPRPLWSTAMNAWSALRRIRYRQS